MEIFRGFVVCWFVCAGAEAECSAAAQYQDCCLPHDLFDCDGGLGSSHQVSALVVQPQFQVSGV